MRKLFETYPTQTNRAVEILIPLTSWLLLTMPLWLSFWHPAIVAYIIITFDVYWLYKSALFAFHAVKSFITMTAHTAVDWHAKAEKISGFHQLYHVVIIPEYKEPIHILERTLTNLTKQDFPHERLIIVLATEEKDPESDDVGKKLQTIFSPQFGHFIVTKHTLTEGEVAGKSSNMAHAAKEVVTYLKQKNIPLEQVTVTSCDADALIHPKYFSNVSVQFLTDTDRFDHFYQGAILFYSNIWRIPLTSRVLNTLNSVLNLSQLSQNDKLINFSTYTLSLQTAVGAGYWGRDVIPEDYHLFFRVYFSRGSKVKTKSIFLPILVDAAESHTFFRTILNQYEQAKRWAWGVSDIPFVVRGIMLHPEIPLFDRLRRLFLLLEQHIFWPTNWFLLTLGSALPPLVNPAFGRTALGHNLSQLSSGILTICLLFLAIVIIVDWRVKPPRPREYPSWKLPILVLQWITLPVLSFFLSALPGLDAHTRLLLGKRLEYRVTEKV